MTKSDNHRYYKGDKCIQCGTDITIKNKSGYCRKCRDSSWSDEQRHTMSLARMAENNPMWAGDRVSMNALHEWVRKRIPKPDKCQRCGIVPPRDLSNKGVYDRNTDNWEWLCRRCHMEYDGRLDRLIQQNKGGKREDE